ncbi:MAG: GNAT family N-acetyltransferase [Caulobacteraceae bacterium]
MAGPLSGELDPEATVSAHTCKRPSPGSSPTHRSAMKPMRPSAWPHSGRIPLPRGFALIRREDQPAAVGACAVEGEWAGIMGMRTAPAFRRQGLARRLFRTLMAFAASAGAVRAYLQVDQDNASAIALYEPRGRVRLPLSLLGQGPSP